jgi:Domain of unknown function (DUF6249)
MPLLKQSRSGPSLKHSSNGLEVIVGGEETAIILVSAMGILAGLFVMWMAMQSRRHLREMQHRERIAMIERGLVPAPEVDPVGFERAIGVHRAIEPKGAGRMRSLGVIVIALGFGFMLLLSVTAETPNVGIGIGGAFTLLGVALIINSVLTTRSEPPFRVQHEIREPVIKPEPPERPSSLT